MTMFGWRLRTVVGLNVMLPSVVAPDMEMLGSRFRLVNCEISEAASPTVSHRSGSPAVRSVPASRTAPRGIDQCPGVERRHGIHHATIAVLATVAMIPTAVRTCVKSFVGSGRTLSPSS